VLTSLPAPHRFSLLSPNGVNVYLGVGYTGRRASDASGQMTLGEATMIDGTGVQTITNSRWGDYT
jgi:hypothetical protein